jgi:hypothetical protein
LHRGIGSAAIVGRLLLAAALLATSAGAAHADSEAPPRDWARTLPGGALVFVMLASAPWADRDPRLRARYRKSGLYRADGSGEPLWTVDWYAWSVDISADGRYLVQHGPWPRTGDDLAVGFHAGGVETSSYRIRDLVRDPARLPRTVSHFTWCRTWEFDVQSLRLSIVTLNAECYVFDVTTGQVLERDLPDIDEQTRDGWTLSKCLAKMSASLPPAPAPENVDTVATAEEEEHDEAPVADPLAALLAMAEESSVCGPRAPVDAGDGRALDSEQLRHLLELRRRHESWFATLVLRAVPVLVRLADVADRKSGLRASMALAQLGHATTHSMRWLAQGIGSARKGSRSIQRFLDALEALGRLQPGPPGDALPDVLPMLDHGDPAVVQAALRVGVACARAPGAPLKDLVLGLPAVALAQRRYRRDIVEAAAPLEEPLLRALVPWTRDPDWQVCYKATWAIARSGPAARCVASDIESLRGTRTGLAGRKLDDLVGRAVAKIRGST